MFGNVQWFQTYHNAIVEVIDPRIFDHTPMRFRAHTQVLYRKTIFKFLNFITQDPSYLQIVARIWKENVRGSAMYRVWRKLLRLQPSIKPLVKSVTDIQIQIQQARQDSLQAHENLNSNLFDRQAIDQVKICNDYL